MLSDALGALSPADRWPNRARRRLMPPIDRRKPPIDLRKPSIAAK
jgi:hypothetical protein